MTIKVKLHPIFVKSHEKGGRNFLAGIVRQNRIHDGGTVGAMEFRQLFYCQFEKTYIP
jgi:hypothetical protein